MSFKQHSPSLHSHIAAMVDPENILQKEINLLKISRFSVAVLQQHCSALSQLSAPCPLLESRYVEALSNTNSSHIDIDFKLASFNIHILSWSKFICKENFLWHIPQIF